MISATIITKNEEKNIDRCLASLFWADEIIVVDSGSTDKTLKICEKYQTCIIETDWLGFGKTKQLAVNNAKYDWIFSIDADEEVSPRLAEKIKDLKLNKFDYHSGFKIKRESFYLGKKIRFSGWQNDNPLRLFNKNFGSFNDREVHEMVVMNEQSLAFISEPIIHYPYESLFHHVNKINHYTDLTSINYSKKGKKSSIAFSLLSSFYKFFKTYIIRLGFLDGKEGFVLSIMSSYSNLLKYLKLWQINKNK